MQRRFIARGRHGALAEALRAALPEGSTLVFDETATSDDVLVLIEPDAATIRAAFAPGPATPILLLRTSALPGRVDLDWLRPPAHATTRRARAADAFAALDAATILAEAGPLAWPENDTVAPPGVVCVLCEAHPSGAERSAMAEALGEAMLTTAEDAAGPLGWSLRAVTAEDLPGLAHGTPVVMPANARARWRALASGAEVVLCGPCPDPPDIGHAAAQPADVSRAFRDIADGARRNARDAVMAALAGESLFLALPASGPALDTALAQELACALWRPPRLTIIVNCYNYREFVRDAVLSACGQSDPADQILVVDDGSTDGSMEALDGIQGVRILRKPNGGQASAFNLGVAEADGDVILFLDADDRLLPGAVERLRAAWRPGLSRMQFALETIDSQGHATGLYPDAAAMLSGDLTGRIAGWGNYPFMPTSGNAYAVAALRAVMPIPEDPWRLCADHYLNVLTPFEGEILSIPDVLGQYRVHGRNGHFHPFGDLAFRELHHLKYRVRVWRDLLRHLSRRSGRLARLRRLQTHRRLLAASADPRTAALVPWPAEALAAVRLAIAEGSWKQAFDHVGYAALSGLRRLWSSRDDGPVTGAIRWPWPGHAPDEVLAASNSLWPLLHHGTDIDARTPAGLASWPGWGWRALGRGQPVEAGPTAQLAFRLPWQPSHWLLRLHLARPLPDRVVVTLNGQRLLDVAAPGSQLDVLLPAELLRSGGESRLCDLLLSTVGEQRLRLSGLHCRAVPRAPGAAPLAVPGRWLALADRTQAALALGRGWEWPSAHEVAAAGQQARLHLTLPPEGQHWMIRLRCAPLGATAPILFVDGTRCPVFVSEDGRMLTLRWQRRRAGVDPVTIDIVAPRGEALDLRLEAVRADRLAPGRAAFDEPQEGDPGQIDPARLDADRTGPTGPVPLPARLTLTPPVAGDGCRARLLLVRNADEDAAPPLLVTGPGLRAQVIAGLAAEIRVPLMAGSASTALAFGPGHHGVQLKSVTYVDTPPREDIPTLAPGEALDGDALASAVLHEGDWMEPVEGALWLRGLAGGLALRIERSGPAGLRLEIGVLCLPGEGLEVVCEGVSVTVSTEATRIVSFDLAPRRIPGPTLISVRTHTLVPLPSPVPTSAMIGGAVTRVAVVGI